MIFDNYTKTEAALNAPTPTPTPPPNRGRGSKGTNLTNTGSTVRKIYGSTRDSLKATYDYFMPPNTGTFSSTLVAAGEVVETASDLVTATAHTIEIFVSIAEITGGVAVVAVGAVAAVGVAFAAPITAPILAGVSILLHIKSLYSNRTYSNKILQKYTWNLINEHEPEYKICWDDTKTALTHDQKEHLNAAHAAAEYILSKSENQYQGYQRNFKALEKNFIGFWATWMQEAKTLYTAAETAICDAEDADQAYQRQPTTRSTLGPNPYSKFNAKCQEINAKYEELLDRLETAMSQPSMGNRTNLHSFRPAQFFSSAVKDKARLATQARSDNGVIFEYMRLLIHFGQYLQCSSIITQCRRISFLSALHYDPSHDPRAQGIGHLTGNNTKDTEDKRNKLTALCSKVESVNHLEQSYPDGIWQIRQPIMEIASAFESINQYFDEFRGQTQAFGEASHYYDDFIFGTHLVVTTRKDLQRLFYNNDMLYLFTGPAKAVPGRSMGLNNPHH